MTPHTVRPLFKKLHNTLKYMNLQQSNSATLPPVKVQLKGYKYQNMETTYKIQNTETKCTKDLKHYMQH